MPYPKILDRCQIKLFCHHRRFNLVELLVVIAILMILTSLLQPSIKSVVAKSEQLNCSQNLKACSIMISSYAENHDGIMPRNWSGPIEKENPSQVERLLCPYWFPEKYAKVTQTYGMRITNSSPRTALIDVGGNLHHSTIQIHDPSSFVLLADTAKYTNSNVWEQNWALNFSGSHASAVGRIHLRHSERANVLYVDGHVEANDEFDLRDDDLKYLNELGKLKGIDYLYRTKDDGQCERISIK